MNTTPPPPQPPDSTALPSLREVLTGTWPLLRVHLAIEYATPAELGQAHHGVGLASVQTRPADPDAPPPHSADGQRAALRTLVQRRYARELRAGFDAIPFAPGDLDSPQVLGPLGLILLAQRALLGERTAYLAGPSADRLRLLAAWLGGHCAGVDRSRHPGLGDLMDRATEICLASELDELNHRRGVQLARRLGVADRREAEEERALVLLGAGHDEEAVLVPYAYGVQSTP